MEHEDSNAEGQIDLPSQKWGFDKVGLFDMPESLVV
jgi:hypothetical protein